MFFAFQSRRYRVVYFFGGWFFQCYMRPPQAFGHRKTILNPISPFCRLPHLIRIVVASGDHTVTSEIRPRFDRVTSLATATAIFTAERQLFGRQHPVKSTVGGHAQTVRKRTNGTKRLNEVKY